MDIAVIRWPEKVLLAPHSLLGAAPPNWIIRKVGDWHDEHGVMPLVDWIKASQQTP